MAQTEKNLPAIRETQVQSLGQKDTTPVHTKAEQHSRTLIKGIHQKSATNATVNGAILETVKNKIEMATFIIIQIRAGGFSAVK